MKLKEAIERCNELIKEKHANWIGLISQEAISTVLQEIEHLQKENEELKNMDLTTVHIKGVCDEKERWRNKIKEKIEMLKKIYELANVESEADYCLRSKINILEDLLKEE